MAALISLKGVQKRFGSHWALRGVSLDVQPGITGLLGPNGAGKSTLIKLVLGLVRGTSGTGTVLGFPLGRQTRQMRSRIGYVPEDDCYIPGLTGVEVVSFSARLSGLDPVESLRRAHEILDFCGMREDRYRAVEGYSTGMRQKVKFAAALVHDPDLLILDEPTSGLDPEERELFLNRLKLLAARHGKSVLLSTHILPDVQGVCNRVVIMAGGQIRLDQSLQELNRPVEGRFEVETDGDAGPLAGRLRHFGYAPDQIGATRLSVPAADDRLFGRVWELAGECGLVVQSLRPATNSLEAVFLEAIGGTADARP